MGRLAAIPQESKVRRRAAWEQALLHAHRLSDDPPLTICRMALLRVGLQWISVVSICKGDRGLASQRANSPPAHTAWFIYVNT
jgi:hypothetical protein